MLGLRQILRLGCLAAGVWGVKFDKSGLCPCRRARIFAVSFRL